MASTITGLIPTIYEALDVVSREMVGFIPAVSRDTAAERAALNQTILVPVTTAQTAADNTPAVTSPDTGDQTINSVPMTISKSKHVPIRWNGEQQRGLVNAGTFNGILVNQFAQAFRTLVNLIETDLFTAAYQGASRATGTAGTTPFGVAGNLSDVAQLRKLLDDNGAPQTDLQLVLGSSAVANLRGVQTILLKVNESGSAALLRGGSISDVPLEGFALHNSNSVTAVAAGSGNGYLTSGASAFGATGVTLASGTGNVNPGDVVTFAGDPNNYVVNAGITAPGVLSVGYPGLRTSVPTGKAVSSPASYVPNIGFSRSAMQLITRVPAMPMGPDGRSQDLADDMMLVTDPVSGITFEIVLYRQFRQMVYHVAVAWGVAAIKQAHIATLIG